MARNRGGGARGRTEWGPEKVRGNVEPDDASASANPRRGTARSRAGARKRRNTRREDDVAILNCDSALTLPTSRTGQHLLDSFDMFSLSRLARSRYIVSRCLVKCYSMKSAHQKSWKAVLFDAGGVLVASPFPAFRRFENDNDLTPGTLTKVIQNAGDTGPFAKLERGEFTVPEFCEKFDDDIRKATGKEVNSRALMNEIESATQRPVYEMFDAIRCIRAENIKTALVTNNWITENQSISDYLPKNLFNEVRNLIRGEHAW